MERSNQRAESTKPEPSHGARAAVATPTRPAAWPAQLQSRLGNAGVQRLLQARLTVSRPEDPFEQEAERVADRVMRMPAPAVAALGSTGAAVPRRGPTCEQEIDLQPIAEAPTLSRLLEQPMPLQRLQQTAGAEPGRPPRTASGAAALARQPDALDTQEPDEQEQPEPGAYAELTMPEDPAPLQRRANAVGDATQVSTEVDDAIGGLAGRGAPLPEPVRDFMEPRFGADFSAVRIHTDAQAHALARAVNAEAFTVGADLVFGAGHYAPETATGQHLLAHELTHVVQQGAAATSSGGRGHGAARPPTQAIDRFAIARTGAQVRLRTVARLVQGFWVTREAAGGCGICYDVAFPGQGPREAGRVAHSVIQAAFIGALSGLGTYRLVEFPFRAPGDENGRLDLALATPTGFAIGEIKPATPSGEERGLDDLRWYEQAVQAAYPGSTVERLRRSIPVAAGLPMPDVLAALAGCVSQRLAVMLMAPGLYGYWCAPTFGEARRTCTCRPRPPQPTPEPSRERVRVPERNTERPPVRVPEQRPVPRPDQVEEPGRAPERAPDQPEEPVRPPIPLRPPQTPETTEEEETQPDGVEEELPIAAMVAAAVAAAWLASRQAGRQLPGRAAGRALIYAQMAALVAVLVIWPERVEARPGPGESPIEALFKAMRQRGIPVPDDLRARVEADPQLRALVERAASGGDLSATQEELARQMMQIVADHPEEFSNDDLQVLLTASEAAAAASGGSPLSAEQLRRAIDARRRGDSVSDAIRGRSGDAAAGRGAPPPVAAEPERAAEPAVPNPAGPDAAAGGTEAAAGLSASGRNRLAGSPTTVRRVFTAMTARIGTGPRVDDEVLTRFLAAVPADLTDAEAARLIAGLGPVSGQSADEILQSVAEAVRTLRAVPTTAPASPPTAPPPQTRTPADTGPPRTPSSTAVPSSEVGSRIAALLRPGPRPGLITTPEGGLRVNTPVTVFVARQRDRFLLGAFVTLTPLRQLSDLAWQVQMAPANWYNQTGQFVDRWPTAAVTTDFTFFPSARVSP